MNHPESLCVMTYNVHSCIGTDGRISPFRIANVIARYEPDVVALQELDVGRARTGLLHQARIIANHLKMDFHFYPSLEIKEEQYGNAILSRHPIRLIQSGPLPTPPSRAPLEQRGALWAAIHFHGRKINIINTHLGLGKRERLLQVRALLSSKWLAHPACHPPVILCGDFNSLPFSKVYRMVRRVLNDVQRSLHRAKPLRTWPSRRPFFRIDHLFTTAEFVVHAVEVPRSHLARLASDHLPLIAKMSLRW